MSSNRVAVAAVMALSLIAGVAQAGGSAHVSFLKAPKQVEAGRVFELAFAVRSDWPMAKDRKIEPTLKAVCGDQVVNIAATPLKANGQFKVAVALPTVGAWTITVDSRFCETRMTPLVLKAVAAKGQQS